MTLLEQAETNTLTITKTAAKAVNDLLEKRELSSDEYALRLFVSGGGCSGFQYGMALEGQVRETDYEFEENGVRLVVDEVSFDYLRGSSVDYVDDIMGSGFKIDNPNAVASCGCGSSFRTSGSGAPASGGGCGSY